MTRWTQRYIPAKPKKNFYLIPLSPDFVDWRSLTAHSRVVPRTINQGKIKGQSSPNPGLVPGKKLYVFCVFSLLCSICSAT